MIEERDQRIDQQPAITADTGGHLAMGLFIGVILLLLVVTYAFATAA